MITKLKSLSIVVLLIACLDSPILHAQTVEWTEIEAGIYEISNNPIRMSAHEGYFYVYVSSSTEPYHFVYRSADGIEWEEVGMGASATQALTLNNGEILLYGDGTEETVISDGESWTTVSVVPEGEFAGVRAAAEGADGRIVLGGTNGTWQVDPAWWVSVDGGNSFTYYKSDGQIGDVGIFEGISGLAFGNGIFVAVGSPGEVWTSTTGEVWEAIELPMGNVGSNDVVLRFSEVRFIDGTFYAVGDYLGIYKSSNGTEWETVYQGTSGYGLTSLLVDGPNWHAAGPTGGQAWSPDGGVTWFSTTTRNRDFSNLTGGGGLLFASSYFAPQGGAVNFFNAIEMEWMQGGWPKVAYTEGKWLVLHNGTAYLGGAPTSFLDSATSSDGVYYEHPWLGWFSKPSNGWIYHYNMGWIFSTSKSDDSVWIFSEGLGWIYTNGGLWPYFYHGESGDWGSYGGGPDWFWNDHSQKWELKGEFGKGEWVVSEEWLIGKTLTITDSEGTHTVEIVSANSVNATFNLDKLLNMTTADTVTWFDSSFAAALPEGHRFTFDIADATKPGIGDRVFPLVFTFTDSSGGTSLMTYAYMQGLFPVSKANIEGTFTVSD